MQAHLGRAGALGVVLCASACANVSQIQPIAKQFSDGAHSVATTEENFFQEVRAADCNSQFYVAALHYAQGKGPPPGVSDRCTPALLNDKELGIRKALLDAVGVYADKIQALATGNTTALDTSAKTLAGDLNRHFSKADKSVAAGVEAAIIELANIALDEQRFTDIRSAASAASPSLTAAVDALKQENTDFSAGIDSKIGRVEVTLNTILHTERGPQAFFDAATARSILAAANPFPGPAAQGAAQESADAMALKLNAALDALLKANTALATSDGGGTLVAVTELEARAKDAQALYAALNK